MTLIIRPSLIDNNSRQQCRWHACPSTSSLEYAAAQAIFNASQQAIRQRGAFHLVLAGGTTPRRVYELLKTKDANWKAWHVYFGDERCLPAGHAERNSRMAAQAWLDHVNIPARQIHIITAEHGAEAAASSYAKILSKVNTFDLVILGLGEDGHTASLFPHHDWGTLPDAPATLAVHDAPKPPPERVSLSAQRLSQTRELLFLVSGAAKRQAVIDWRNGKSIPAAAIAPDCGVDIYLEEDLL
ncbi:MAG TPA: 6-phosphogluconolactonase [Gallionellaceae bacterium]|nr:6-phosphogluconolactonase [Gallionellaceae bacterium]